MRLAFSSADGGCCGAHSGLSLSAALPSSPPSCVCTTSALTRMLRCLYSDRQEGQLSRSLVDGSGCLSLTRTAAQWSTSRRLRGLHSSVALALVRQPLLSRRPRAGMRWSRSCVSQGSCAHPLPDPIPAGVHAAHLTNHDGLSGRLLYEGEVLVPDGCHVRREVSDPEVSLHEYARPICHMACESRAHTRDNTTASQMVSSHKLTV